MKLIKTRKPVIRWTIGGQRFSGEPTSHDGFDCLIRSIFHWRKIYKDKFFVAVCYNNLSPDQLNDAHLAEADCFIDQNQIVSEKISGPSWKISPRIISNSQEIFIDNDLIVYKEIPLLEEFLNGEIAFATEAIGRSYGNLDSLVQSDLKINTGLFGFPKDFNWHSDTKMNGHFDEQGLVASFLVKCNLKILSLSEISIADNRNRDFICGKYGVHFTHLNSSNHHYRNHAKCIYSFL